jgi:two-component system, NarL family, sensor kinase
MRNGAAVYPNTIFMKKYFFYIITAICFVNAASAKNIDSLLTVLTVAKDDTAKVRLLYKIGTYYKSSKFDSAIYFFDKAKVLCEKLNFKPGIISYYLNIQGLYTETGKYDSALIIGKTALDLSEKLGDKTKIAKSYECISNAYFYMLKFDSCIKFDLKTEEIYNTLGDKSLLLILYGNIGSNYSELHRYDKAKQYFFKAIALNNAGVGDDNDLLYVTSSLSATYISLNQLDSALYYAEKTITLCEKEKNYYVEKITLGNILNIKLSQGKYNELLTTANRMADLKPKINTPEYEARLSLNYAIAYFYSGKAKLAEEYALSALKISEPNKLPVISKNSYSILNKIEAVLGNYELSDKYESLKDSISNVQINETSIKNIQELETKYETTKKEKEITQLNASNQRKAVINYALAGTTVALGILGFIGYRNFQQRKKIQQQKITELEKDKQLSAIDAMLKGQEEERSRIAKDLHDGLGGMLSGTKLSFINMKENLVLTPENATRFDKSLSMLDNTIADLRKVAHNLMPEALVKFGLNEALRDFCNSIQSSSILKVAYQQLGEKRKLTNTAAVFTYRIIQELVNNTVKHANAQQIIVQLNVGSNNLYITVEDDGNGFDINSIANSKGAGMNNIKYRVQYFNGTLDIVSGPGNGTAVNIELTA